MLRESPARSARTLLVVLLLPLVFVVAMARNASAQPAPQAAQQAAPPPTPAQLAEAKKFFEAGVKFSQQGQYQDALAAFLEANRISPRPSIQKNIAQTYRDLRDYAAAYAAYDELLTKFGSQLKPPEVQATQKAMQELEAFTGTIEVKQPEAGAHVTVDGKDAGLTPLPKPLRFNVGQHTVGMTKEGFDPFSKVVDLQGHDAVVIADPLVREAANGHVTLSVVPQTPGAIITMDNTDLGPAPVQADVPAGTHVFSARGPGLTATPQQVEVLKKGMYDITIPLVATDAVLNVVVQNVADAEISIDGQVVGRGTWEAKVAPGRHVLRVKRDGYSPYEKIVDVALGHNVENVALVAVAAAPPPPPPPQTPKEKDWTGTYSQLRVKIGFQINQPTNDIAQGVGYGKDAAIATDGAVNFEPDLRFGYSFGPAGIELGIFALYRHGQSTVNVKTATNDSYHPGVAPRVDDYDFHYLGGGLELGGRFMPRFDTVRPTVGVAGGIGLYGALFNQNITPQGKSGNGYPSDFTGYFVPRIAADAGVLLGGTPGTKFFIGAMLLAEFAGSNSTRVSQSTAQAAAGTSALSDLASGTLPSLPGNKQINVVNGPEVFLGPVFGIQFGQ
jgi:hypothetical protein